MSKTRKALGRMVPEYNDSKAQSKDEILSASNDESTYYERLKKRAGRSLKKNTHEAFSVRIQRTTLERFDDFTKERDLKKGEVVDYALNRLMDEIEKGDKENE